MTHSVASVLHPCAIACNDFHDVQQTVIPHDLLICDAICPDHSQPPNLSKDMLQLMLYSHTCPFSHVTGRIWTCKTATSAQQAKLKSCRTKVVDSPTTRGSKRV